MAKMEAAAEADMEDHVNKRPAIQKLKILAEVEDFLSQVCCWDGGRCVDGLRSGGCGSWGLPVGRGASRTRRDGAMV